VAQLALSRNRNKNVNVKITDDQLKRIEGWLGRNQVDYKMLPHEQDPRFAGVNSEWNQDWGWPRNAASSLSDHVAAIVSAQDVHSDWIASSKWRRLLPSQSIHESVPEFDIDNRSRMVRRDAKSLASLVAHPLQFGNRLKMIDPYADYEGWHPTLEEMLRLAKHKLTIELHCARCVPRKRPDGPSEGARKAWCKWAESSPQRAKLHRLHVFFWRIEDKSVLENHDRYAIVSNDVGNGSMPFAGISVGKGWDQAPPRQRKVETYFGHLPKIDQKKFWEHYTENSVTLKRDTSEDVVCPSIA
jgi:hypothetical protein